MLFSVLYLLLRRLLGRSDSAREERDIELLVLRHQVKVLRRQVKRPALHRSDRLLLVAASRRLPRTLWSVFIVRPETLLRSTGSWSAGSGRSGGRASRVGR